LPAIVVLTTCPAIVTFVGVIALTLNA